MSAPAPIRPLMVELQALVLAQQRVEQVLTELAAAQRRSESALTALPERLALSLGNKELKGSAPDYQSGGVEAQVELSGGSPRPQSLTPMCVSTWTKQPSVSHFPSEAGSESPKHDQDGIVAPMLPPHWPIPIKIQQGLVGSGGQGSVLQRCAILRTHAMSDCVSMEAVEKRGSNAITSALRNPHSATNVALVLLSMFVLLHDLCLIPYALARHLPFAGYFQASSLASACFWTMSIGLTFSRGFYSKEQLITAPKMVARQYLSTRFLPDALLTCCDWLSLGVLAAAEAAPSDTAAKLSGLANFARVLRVAAAFRLVRVAASFRDVHDRVTPEAWRWASPIAWLICAALLVTHSIACSWLAVGRWAYSDTGARWTDYQILYRGEVVPLRETEGSLYLYLTAFYWSLAVLTQGSAEFPCTNGLERLFNSLCLLAGFLAGSMCVSSLSAKMVEFQALQSGRVQQLRQLRRYLEEHRVSPSLSIITVRQAAQRIQARKPLTTKDVPVLELLPSVLRKQLHSSLCAPQLVQHPLFRVFSNLDAAWLDRFCNEAVDIGLLGDTDELFISGTAATAAYVLVNGQMHYRQVPESSPVGVRSKRHIPEGAWLCESALWSHWIHVGTAEAIGHCRFLTLRTAATVESLQRHHTICTISQAYCIEFHRRIVASRPPFVDWPDDLTVPATAFEDIVMSMPLPVGIIIGFQAVDHFLANAGRREGVFFGLHHSHTARLENESLKLKEEIRGGQCAVCLDDAGRVVRITSVVLLQAVDKEGLSLWQMGKVEGERILAKVEMPGTKCQHGESAQEALDRLLSAQLAPLAGCAAVQGEERNVTEATSGAYGVHTKYLRTVFSARLQGPLRAPQCTLQQSIVRDMRFCQYRSTGSTSRPSTTALVLGMDAHLQAFADRPVYVLHHRGVARLYAWLSTDEVEHFGTSLGYQVLSAWLNELVLPLKAAEEAEFGPVRQI